MKVILTTRIAPLMLLLLVPSLLMASVSGAGDGPMARYTEAPDGTPAWSPSATEALEAGRSALDYYFATGDGMQSDAGWQWASYYMAVEAMYRQTGEKQYQQRLQDWGERNRWTPDARSSPTSNPDQRAAIQVWYDSAQVGVATDLEPADVIMADDLRRAAKSYWWIDAMFMGLPLWPQWQTRTGTAAYGAKHSQLYSYLKDEGETEWRPGCIADGLFDSSEDLWWRDCKYVSQRDANGNKVFWGRGNGWVLAAMARMLMKLPPTDPSRTEYGSMLKQMSVRLAGLQGDDGMWRSNLLSPSLFPAPETSATALFTYAMAYGIRTKTLDPWTFTPIVERAWRGLTTVLRQDGFLSNCQGVGESPGPPSMSISTAYCVGAFGLAATEVAQLEKDMAASSAAGALRTHLPKNCPLRLAFGHDVSGRPQYFNSPRAHRRRRRQRMICSETKGACVLGPVNLVGPALRWT